MKTNCSDFVAVLTLSIIFSSTSCVSQPPASKSEIRTAPSTVEASASNGETKKSDVDSSSPPVEPKTTESVQTDSPAIPVMEQIPAEQKPKKPESISATSVTQNPVPEKKPVATPPKKAPPSQPPLPPEKKAGSLSFYTGKIQVYRNGAKISDKKMDIGLTIENYDLVQTSAKSTAEIDLDSKYSGGATIKLSEKTAFWFETNDIDSKRKTNIELLAGSVLLKVAKLSGSDSVSVRTESGVLGVRGTVFGAITSPDGKTLVTCVEGSVACKDNSGVIQEAKPGQIVKESGSGTYEIASVAPEALNNYRDSWFSERLNDFASSAPIVIAGYSVSVKKALPDFEKAYSDLQEQKAIFVSWEKAIQSGTIPSFAESANSKKIIAPLLFNALKSMFSLERPLVRLSDIQQNYRDIVLKAPNASETLRILDETGKDADSIFLKISEVRSYFRLFAKISQDSPLGDFFADKALGSSVFGDDGFFDN